VLGAAALWSTSGLFIRWTVAAGGLSAVSLAFWRDLVTFGCLLIGLGTLRPQWLRVQGRDLPWLVGFGVTGIATFHVLWNVAILRIGYGVATILLYSSPAFVVLAARLLWQESITRRKALALILTLGGCVLVGGREELAGIDLTAGGLLLGLGAALAYGSFSLFGRQVAPRYSPWTVLTYGFGFATLALLPLQLRVGLPGRMPAEAWVWFAALVGAATLVPFAAYLAGLRHLPVGVAILLASSEVVFGSLLGYLLVGEGLAGWQMLGGAMVVAGVVLISGTGADAAGR
jgi:drug/metabolite transporter (DMT)-like permease